MLEPNYNLPIRARHQSLKNGWWTMFLPADNRLEAKAKTTTIHHGEGAHRLDSSINLRYELGCIQFCVVHL